MTNSPESQLVVVLHADVVGSTDLVHRNQEIAHERFLDAFRRLSQSIESYGGKTKELRGDALLGQFSRVSDAVCAAISFQEKNAEHNARLEDEIQPSLRIGIAMGEVVVDENLMTGTSVVLAQRLEQLAEPGGICLQATAYDILPGNLPFDCRSLGTKALKGFDEAIGVYQVSLNPHENLPSPHVTPPTAIAFDVVQQETPRAVDGASIAVMPFANLGGNPEQDYFSHGITMEVHSDLTRFKDLFVSGRSSCLNIDALTSDVTEIGQRLGVQYLVRGGVRSDGKRLRINAELVDSESGNTLWSERYDRTMEDIFDIEVDVANTIAATLKIRLEDALYERSRDRSAERLSAYDWILRGNRSLELGGSENWDNAKREFGRALELDPHSSTASAGLSITYAYECSELAARDYRESLDLHLEFAEKALALDPSDSRAHYAMSCAHTLFGRFDLGYEHAARAMKLNPGEYHNICSVGYSLMCLDRFEESSRAFSNSLRSNPLAPNSCLLALGNIEYQEENFGQSAITLARMTPSYIARLSSLAATYSQLGYDDAARDAAREFWALVETRPGCPLPDDSGGWRNHWRLLYPWGSEESFEKLLDGIARAGMPV